MEYQVEIPTLGKGTRLKKMMEKRLPRLNQRIFTFGEVQLIDGMVVVEFDLDEEAAAKWCLQRFFLLAGLDFGAMGTGANIAKLAKRARTRRGKFVKDDPETETDEAWVGGKAPAKKKAAPKKKAPAKKKAAPKKKATKK
tara:strand:- start:16 stop:435 length:420 start_codon:yes stop_codon:yes gene_type:complete